MEPTTIDFEKFALIYKNQKIPQTSLELLWARIHEEACILCKDFSRGSQTIGLFIVEARDFIKYGGDGIHSRHIWYSVCANCAGDKAINLTNEFTINRIEKQIIKSMNKAVKGQRD